MAHSWDPISVWLKEWIGKSIMIITDGMYEFIQCRSKKEDRIKKIIVGK